MPVPPTAEEWESHRQLIAELYTRRTLKAIRAHLKDAHGFNATERMYKGRLKSWGIEKNKRHSRKPRQERASPSDAVSQTELAATTPTNDCRDDSHVQPPSGFSFALTPPGASPYNNESVLETRSTTYVGTPSSFPPTPATTSGGRSPTAYDPEDTNADPEVLCREIVNFAISILSRLVPGRPAGAGLEEWTPTDDHLAIYRTLQQELKHESHIRGCLVNNPSVAATASLSEHVKDLIGSFHPAVPIGVLSTINQSLDYGAIRELASCLAATSVAILPRNDDFVLLAHRLRRLLTITTFETFQQSMEQICEILEAKVLKVLGKRSLVMIYLMFLLNAKKAKNKLTTDNKILNLALERRLYVQHVYAHDPKLVLQFSHFIIGYRILVTPEGQSKKDILDMAEECYKSAEKYLHDQESSTTSKKADVTDAKSHYGKSCSLLADCRYDQGWEYEDYREELHDSSRRLLLMSIGCHVDCPMGTMAQFDRQKQKLEKWCNDANDTSRLQQLNDIHELIKGNEQRPKDGPLLPRLQVLV